MTTQFAYISASCLPSSATDRIGGTSCHLTTTESDCNSCKSFKFQILQVLTEFGTVWLSICRCRAFVKVKELSKNVYSEEVLSKDLCQSQVKEPQVDIKKDKKDRFWDEDEEDHVDFGNIQITTREDLKNIESTTREDLRSTRGVKEATSQAISPPISLNKHAKSLPPYELYWHTPLQKSLKQSLVFKNSSVSQNIGGEELYEQNPHKLLLKFQKVVSETTEAVVRWSQEPLWFSCLLDTDCCPDCTSKSSFLFQVLPYFFEVYKKEIREYDLFDDWSTILVFRCNGCNSFYCVVQGE